MNDTDRLFLSLILMNGFSAVLNKDKNTGKIDIVFMIITLIIWNIGLENIKIFLGL